MRICKTTVDKLDAWFWSPEWQNTETEAQQDIESGNVNEFANAEGLIAHLNGNSSEFLGKHDETLKGL